MHKNQKRIRGSGGSTMTCKILPVPKRQPQSMPSPFLAYRVRESDDKEILLWRIPFMDCVIELGWNVHLRQTGSRNLPPFREQVASGRTSWSPGMDTPLCAYSRQLAPVVPWRKVQLVRSLRGGMVPHRP
mmetsp:Transcript_8703/g.17658  ORF Transcript_8703/g.17658 Transcript_8703/m.17658 type:complete len:130 (-) Transcript_8703:472-861(-)